MFHYQQMFDLCTYFIILYTQGIYSRTQGPVKVPQERGCEWNQGFKAVDSENHQWLNWMWRLTDARHPRTCKAEGQEDQQKSKASQIYRGSLRAPVKAT